MILAHYIVNGLLVTDLTVASDVVPHTYDSNNTERQESYISNQ